MTLESYIMLQTPFNTQDKHPSPMSETFSMIWLVWPEVTHINCRGLQNLATTVKPEI